MKFQPKSDEELQKEEAKRGLWEKGAYSYEILPYVTFGTKTIQTCDTKSSAGNDMLVLAVKVFNDDGRESVIVDYITDAVGFKLKHLAYANGLGSQYDAGELHAIDLIGKCGKAKVGVSKGKAKNDGSGENYSDKNSIVDYLVEESADQDVVAKNSDIKATSSLGDDSTIPF